MKNRIFYVRHVVNGAARKYSDLDSYLKSTEKKCLRDLGYEFAKLYAVKEKTFVVSRKDGTYIDFLSFEEAKFFASLSGRGEESIDELYTYKLIIPGVDDEVA